MTSTTANNTATIIIATFVAVSIFLAVVEIHVRACACSAATLHRQDAERATLMTRNPRLNLGTKPCPFQRTQLFSFVRSRPANFLKSR